MSDVLVVKWLVIVIAIFTVLSGGFTILYLRRVREKIRQHRHVKRMVTEASKPGELFGHPTR